MYYSRTSKVRGLKSQDYIRYGEQQSSPIDATAAAAMDSIGMSQTQRRRRHLNRIRQRKRRNTLLVVPGHPPEPQHSPRPDPHRKRRRESSPDLSCYSDSSEGGRKVKGRNQSIGTLPRIEITTSSASLRSRLRNYSNEGTE